jgi:hypothetical protein
MDILIVPMIRLRGYPWDFEQPSTQRSIQQMLPPSIEEMYLRFESGCHWAALQSDPIPYSQKLNPQPILEWLAGVIHHRDYFPCLRRIRLDDGHALNEAVAGKTHLCCRTCSRHHYWNSQTVVRFPHDDSTKPEPCCAWYHEPVRQLQSELAEIGVDLIFELQR